MFAPSQVFAYMGVCVCLCACACLFVGECVRLYTCILIICQRTMYIPAYHGVQNYTSHAMLSFCLGIWHSFLSLHPACQEVFQASMYSACCDCEVYSADLAYCEHVVNKVLNFERVEAVAAWVMIGTRCV